MNDSNNNEISNILSKDILEVHSASAISNVNIEVVTRLYQPIIGHNAAILYLTLVNYANNSIDSTYTHEYMFNIMQITSGDFLLARKALEAVGLIRSYLKIENGNSKHYTYVVFAPKSPAAFFSDVLFKGMLVNYIGQEEATKLAMYYKVDIDINGSKDVSANFVEVFQPDLKDKSFSAVMPTNLKDTRALKVDTQFSFDKFFTHLKTANGISDNVFSKEECNEIERISTLYGLDVITVCDIVAQSYDDSKKFGKRVDINAFKDKAMYQAKYSQVARKNKDEKTLVNISGKTVLADSIKLMESISPKQYLQEKQDGAPPVTADLKLINYLSENMGLNLPTINALIDHCLKACDDRLIRTYVEKVAASLKRAKINTAIDTINYLEKHYKKTPASKAKTQYNKAVVNETDDDSYDTEEYEKLLAKFK